MKIMILLTKEDIGTTQLGLHLVIRTKEGLEINLNPEAIDELLNDLSAFKERQKSEIIEIKHVDTSGSPSYTK